MKKILNNNKIFKYANVQSFVLLGLIGFLLIMLLLSVTYYFGVRNLNNNFNKAIIQPNTINKNIGDIELEIKTIQLILKDVLLTQNEKELNKLVTEINHSEEKIYELFNLISEKLEENSDDLISATKTFANWKPIRDEIIDLISKNQTRQADQIEREKEANHVNLLFEKTKKLTVYADAKASRYNIESIQFIKDLKRKIVVFGVLAIILGVVIIIWVFYRINKPLDKIIARISNLSDDNLLKKLPEKTNNRFYQLDFLLQELETRKTKLQLSIQNNTRELNQAQNLLEKAIEGAPIGMVMISLDNKFERVNKAFSEFIGYSKEELKKLTFNEITHKDDKHIGVDFIKKALAGETELITFEKRYIHKNGNILYVLITAALLRDEKNEPLYFFTQIRDITQQKNYETELIKHKSHLENEAIARAKMIAEKTKKLEKSQLALSYLLEDVNDIRQQLEISNIKLTNANKELEAFSYSVSHDLKAPLRAIDGFSKILIEDHQQSLNDEGSRVLNVIIDNANKMRVLIDDILELSRLGRKQLIFSEISVNLMLEEIVKDFEPILNNRNINWKINEVPNIVGDKVLIKQLLINLVSNAIKFTGQKEISVIEIGSEVKDNNVVYFIKDNGVGFEMKYVDKVFEVFQRLHLTNEFEGTGIGLAIVKRIIDKHNGKVWIESKLDKGTQIYFTL